MVRQDESIRGGSTGADAGSPAALAITYYTDPLCSWSWALEPQWRRLRYEYEGLLVWRYCMGGLIPSWDRYDDPINSVSRPAQMGPIWLQVRHLTGMPIRDTLWIEDPPSSSYPACIAFKAAELQSPEAGEAYLRRLREAVMLEGRNVSRRDVIESVAGSLAAAHPEFFQLDAFLEAFDGGTAAAAFRDDLREIRFREVGRFPMLTLRSSDGRGVMIVGYRPYEVLRTALCEVCPEIAPTRSLPDRAAYARYWGSITERELDEIGPGISDGQ